MAAHDQTPPAERRPTKPEPDGEPAEQQDEQDQTVAESFPASDPPASTGIIGPRRKPGSRPAGGR